MGFSAVRVLGVRCLVKSVMYLIELWMVRSYSPPSSCGLSVFLFKQVGLE